MKVDNTLIQQAADIIKQGGLVAFPTETVYGLGADALNPTAVNKIFQTKGRPANNPVIVHIADESDLSKVAKNVPMMAKLLINNFWPGPLTLILEKTDQVPMETTGGLSTIAVRMPSHPVAQKLIRLAGTPIAAPSANTSGRPSPTNYQHVVDDLGNSVDLIIDGGPSEYGVESTVIDMTGETPIIYRPGSITLEQIEKLIGTTEYYVQDSLIEEIKSPGMAYKHYAPEAPLYLIDDNFDDLLSEYLSQGLKIGILATHENLAQYPEQTIVFDLGYRSSLSSIAQNIYAGLLDMDKKQVDIILSETFPKTGIGTAIMDRLERASQK